MAVFNTPPAGTEVFAIFNAEIYEVYDSTYKNLVATFTSYQDICDWVADNYLELEAVIGLDDYDEKMYYKQKYKDLLVEFEQYKKESIKWDVQDFLNNEGRYNITPENAQLALEQMIRHHDASNGITWETLDWYLQEYGEPIENFDSRNK